MNGLKRERVLAVLGGMTPDRTPLYDLLYNDAIIEHFTGQIPRPGNEGLGVVCEAIGKALDMTRSITPPQEERQDTIDDGELEGFALRWSRWTCWVERRPFSDLEGAKRFIARSIRFRKDWQPSAKFVEDYREEFKKYEEFTDGTVVLHHPSPVGIDTAYSWLGWESFALLLKADPGLLEAWLEAMLEQELRRVEAIADPDISPAVLVYSDIASKNGLLVSPRFLKEAFVPRLRRLTEAWHARGISCLFHSDGDLSPILDDIVGAGVDGINPLEKTDRMDIFTTYERFGDRIYYAGGVDVKVLNVRPCDEVEALARRIIRTVLPHRLFLGSSTELSNDTPLENFLALYDVAHAREGGEAGG